MLILKDENYSYSETVERSVSASHLGQKTVSLQPLRGAQYRRLYLGFLDDAPADPPLVPTFDYILTSSPFIDVSDSEGPTTAQLTMARNHRGGLTGHPAGCVGETPLTGETRPPGMSRGRVVNSHATPP